jgi:dUTP pyrophosphatase
MPRGYKALITPRSGLALKKGITVLNAPGLIDSDYRGEIGVILYNTDSVPHIVEAGDRIAQMQFEKVITVDFVSVDNLDETNRSGGFGSTGT